MRFYLAIMSLLALTFEASLAQSGEVLAIIAVAAGSHERVDTPVTAGLGGIPINSPFGGIQLIEISDGENLPLPSQVLAGDPPRLAWVLGGRTLPGHTRTFELRRTSAPNGSRPGVAATDNGAGIEISVEARPVLAYRHTPQPVPEGVDAIFERGGFIHPLRSPLGEVLTRIQPPDHWHHYGLWNPWTRTEFEGRAVDFWNLGEGQGTVRSAAVLEATSGPVVGGFRSTLNHVDFTSGADRDALSEEWSVSVWNTQSKRPVNLIDFESTLSAASDEPLKIVAYRYQGFSLRATEKWGDNNSRLTTSEGFDKSNGNATRARWIDVNGVSESGRAGILMMGHPTNRDYPELLRIWPTGMNEGAQNVFVNFNPAQESDWIIEPGQPGQLRYRLITYDGEMTAEEAQRHWLDWAEPPVVQVRPTTLAGRRILVYTRNGEGFVHDNIAASVEAIRAMGDGNGFAVEMGDDAGLFHADTLARFDALVFSNSNNEAFDTDDQRSALQAYVRSGGGFVGIHSASGSERDWPWFSALLGGNFVRHAPRQDFTAEVVEIGHPATAGIPRRWPVIDDECYFLDELHPANRVLLAADLTTVEDPAREPFPGTIFADRYPIAWYKEFDGGRQFYTSLGHRIEHYSDPLFLAHVLGGLRWVINGDG